MYADFFRERFEAHADQEAIVWNDRSYLYSDLLAYWQSDKEKLEKLIQRPMVVALEGDFSPHAATILLCLIDLHCIIVPLTKRAGSHRETCEELAEAEAVIRIGDEDTFLFFKTGQQAVHPLLVGLKRKNHPGLVFFSSGSTGERKAVVHDAVPLLAKFHMVRKAMRMITFLLFDHMGGLNTLLYILSNAGCMVALSSRQPDVVCAMIEKYRVEALPTSPTFLNLLLLSGAHEKYSLESLKIVTYGTEMMPESTLQRFHALFPHITLLQTYGLSEIGVVRSKSKASDSLWVKIGGEDFQTRVVEGQLEIKAKSAMLGYLNAKSPFTIDGWLRTGDLVEEDGDYIRFLGRASEVINVGGQKVYPAQVESVLQMMPGVEEAVVSGEANVLTGQIVKARVKLRHDEPAVMFKKRLKIFCQGKLENYQIPQKVVVVRESLHSERFKKMRKA
ncbi:MAG: ANL family adenylate-forming protein [Schwartzia sp. (in: firmicutes)]